MGRGFWAVADQALFALSNFAVNVLLARYLTKEDYGAFSVAYTIFLLLGTFHTAVLTEPMLVFGSARYKNRLVAYLRSVLRGHGAFGVATLGAFGIAGIVLMRFDNSPLAPSFLALAIAGPLILFQWLMRRSCYVELRPRLAATAGTLYMAILVLSVLFMYRVGRLEPATALFGMALASLVSGLWISYRLGVLGTRSEDVGLGREVLADHWSYGRWAVGASGLSWAAGNLLYLLLPLFTSLSAVGVLRAAFNLIMPVMQVFTALGTIMLPELVRARTRHTMGIEAGRFLALFLGAAMVYGVLLIVFRDQLITLFYGQKRGSIADLVPVLAAMPIASGIVSVFGSGLRAIENPRAVFFAYLASTGCTATLGTVLVYTEGTLGAAVAMLLASLVTASVAGILFVRALRSESKEPLERLA